MPDIQYWMNDTYGNPQQLTLGPPVTQAEYEATVKQLKKGKDQGKDPGKYNTPPPVGAQTLEAPLNQSFDGSEPVRQRFYMPDGTTREFVPGKSDAEVSRIFNDALHLASLKQWTLSIAIAIFVTLAVSYLLQSLYRVLLYVIYGSAGNRELTDSGEPA